jgi:hypothetical protein
VRIPNIDVRQAHIPVLNNLPLAFHKKTMVACGHVLRAYFMLHRANGMLVA